MSSVMKEAVNRAAEVFQQGKRPSGDRHNSGQGVLQPDARRRGKDWRICF